MNMGLIVGSPTPHYKDNTATMQLVHDNKVTPRMRHIREEASYTLLAGAPYMRKKT